MYLKELQRANAKSIRIKKDMMQQSVVLKMITNNWGSAKCG
jgi:hypothetical protein